MFSPRRLFSPRHMFTR
uniref:Uncharacterized protein n=1 Tax=Rhizophora mucronata TaxID=61149 RepID=A0A2P2NFA7_RHIMU